jgi:hypothetical protein
MRHINPDKTDHHVCLPRQGLALHQLHKLTVGGTWVFPITRDPARRMSNNTLLKALERNKGSMTCHGFRALAMGRSRGSWATVTRSLIGSWHMRRTTSCRVPTGCR